MKASTKRALSLMASAGLIIVALAVYAMLIRPEYRIVQDLRGELASKSELLAHQQSAVTQVQNLIAQYQSVAKLGDTLSLALPEKESVSLIMAQLNTISQSSGLSIQSVELNYLPISPSASKLSFVRNIGALRLDLKLFGSYAALKQFLQIMETNIRIMDTKTLKIETAAKAGQDYFTYHLTVDTYYQSK
jgi:Tfp pilus assembly protein PilO